MGVQIIICFVLRIQSMAYNTYNTMHRIQSIEHNDWKAMRIRQCKEYKRMHRIQCLEYNA